MVSSKVQVFSFAWNAEGRAEQAVYATQAVDGTTGLKAGEELKLMFNGVLDVAQGRSHRVLAAVSDGGSDVRVAGHKLVQEGRLFVSLYCVAHLLQLIVVKVATVRVLRLRHHPDDLFGVDELDIATKRDRDALQLARKMCSKFHTKRDVVILWKDVMADAVDCHGVSRDRKFILDLFGLPGKMEGLPPKAADTRWATHITQFLSLMVNWEVVKEVVAQNTGKGGIFVTDATAGYKQVSIGGYVDRVKRPLWRPEAQPRRLSDSLITGALVDEADSGSGDDDGIETDSYGDIWADDVLSEELRWVVFSFGLAFAPLVPALRILEDQRSTISKVVPIFSYLLGYLEVYREAARSMREQWGGGGGRQFGDGDGLGSLDDCADFRELLNYSPAFVAEEEDATEAADSSTGTQARERPPSSGPGTRGGDDAWLKVDALEDSGSSDDDDDLGGSDDSHDDDESGRGGGHAIPTVDVARDTLARLRLDSEGALDTVLRMVTLGVAWIRHYETLPRLKASFRFYDLAMVLDPFNRELKSYPDDWFKNVKMELESVTRFVKDMPQGRRSVRVHEESYVANVAAQFSLYCKFIRGEEECSGLADVAADRTIRAKGAVAFWQRVAASNTDQSAWAPLAWIAQLVLAVPATAAHVERANSLNKELRDKHGENLKEDHFSDLVCLHHFMRGAPPEDALFHQSDCPSKRFQHAEKLMKHYRGPSEQ